MEEYSVHIMNKPLFQSFGHAALVFAYVAGVAWMMFNGQRIFGDVKSFWMPLILLLLFVLSATITGALVLGKPIFLYLDGHKSEALKFFFYTIGWVAVMTIVVFVSLARIAQ